MRKLLLLIIFVISYVTVKSQKYGNEWINFSQQYFKFPVFDEGIYRIDSTTLSKYFNLTTINPKNFQLFIHGREQALYIEGEADEKINTQDFIEFYGKSFVGEIDSLVYPQIKYVPNPHTGLYNDTVYAFLTFNNLTNNKRYTQETDVNYSAYPITNYFYSEKVFSGNGNYNEVYEYSNNIADPNYTQAESRTHFVYYNGVFTPNFGTLNTYTSSSQLPFHVTVSYAGASADARNLQGDNHAKIIYDDINTNTQILLDTVFYGYTAAKRNFTINPQTLATNPSFTFQSIPTSTFSNIIGLNYLSLYYPHTNNLNNLSRLTLYTDDRNSSSKASFAFSNYNAANSSSVIVYDLTNQKRIATLLSGSTVSVVIPNGGGRKKCLLTGDSAVFNVTKLTKVNQTGYFKDYSALNTDKAYVILYNKELKNSASLYNNYRKSSAGGSFNVVLEDVDNLYEQFSYGVNKHPIALKRFFKFLNDKPQSKPSYILLIGKGIRCHELGSSTQPENLLPAFGVPSCDNLFTSAITDNSNNYYAPEIAIGRISALTNSEVENYLNKVKEHDKINLENASQANHDWKKRVLHFVGGDSPSLIGTITNYMQDYAKIIEDTLFGAKVFTYKKTTDAPIQTNVNDSVYKSINYGSSILTFFGHGGEAEFDLAIDDPRKYNNKGRYPFLISNSCFSGDLFIPTRSSVSQRFLFEKDKGSIGFVATTSYGLDYYLYNYTRELYKALSSTTYNKGLGDAVKEAAYQASITNDLFLKFVGLDMTFHGDPAVVVNPGPLPDYELKSSELSFDLKTHSDSIGIKFSINNKAKAINDSINYKLIRYSPEGDSIIVSKTIKAPNFSQTISFFIPIDFKRGFGLNNFSIKIDYTNSITEINENNNAINKIDLFIPGGDILPVYPYKYAVVPKTNNITLKASTADPFSPKYKYRFELDTSDRFNHLLNSAVIESRGGVVEWNVDLPYADSTVYFWRVSRDSTPDNNFYNWRESSFQTIGTKRGWSQAHFHQFKNNTYLHMDYKKNERKFSFDNSLHLVECNNGVYPETFEQLINFSFDGAKLGDFGCSWNGWNIVVFDSISGLPLRAETPTPNQFGDGVGYYGNCVCHNGYYFHSFGFNGKCGGSFNINWQNDLETFLNNIPLNNYVLAFSLRLSNVPPQNPQFSTYSKQLFSALESIGAKKIRFITDTVPYIVFGKKVTGKSTRGLDSYASNEIVGMTASKRIYLRDSIRTRWKDGYITSELIGPSTKWNSLHWEVQNADNKPGDSTWLYVYGINAIDKSEILLATFSQTSLNVLNLDSYISAVNYPFIKLKTYSKDFINTTAPQLKRWQVLYDEAPECAINPLKGFASINDTLQQGDMVSFRFPIENIGAKNFDDSLVITYWIEDANLNKTPLPQKLKKRPFEPGQLLIDTVNVSTHQLSGENALWLNVNPIQNLRYQHEQFQFNNVGRFPFQVSLDKTNPLLEVTFDGNRILNGDIVSAKPNIVIALKDENKFLALNDTSAFTIKLQAPGENAKQIYFAQGLEFTPASLPKNSCSISYNPHLNRDGKYVLSVQAKDRSSNFSATNDFVIQFEVHNQPSITQVLNYPNPFTTSTRFVFTITGSEIPEVFTIQIMTITGKIVREITRAELGNLRIGRNITEFAWDGKDKYNDRLANGVYLYRVITKLNGQSLEQKSSEADKFFTKEFGKLVIMR